MTWTPWALAGPIAGLAALAAGAVVLRTAPVAALPFQYLSFLRVALDLPVIRAFRSRAALLVLCTMSVAGAATLLLFPRVVIGELHSPDPVAAAGRARARLRDWPESLRGTTFTRIESYPPEPTETLSMPCRPSVRLVPVLAAVALAACDRTEEFSAPGRPAAPIARAFVGATIVDGTGGPVILNGVVLVGADGRIAEIGRTADVHIPEGAERVDVAGRFIVPGLVNSHGHVGDTRGLEAGHYTRENVLDQLGIYARYGVTTVLSLGGDGPEGVAVRDAQASPTLNRARLFVAGAVVTGDTPEAAREMVDANAALGADFIKIRVDDNLGTTEKMAPDVYGAVIDRAHELELPVAAHIFYLDDAKALVDAGVDFIAHSVRDREIDGSFAAALIGNGVCYTPTLAREVTTFIYGSTPGFFEDPFFLAEADTSVIRQLKDPERQAGVRNSPTAQAYQRALAQGEANLKILSDAGVRIALGTDTGPPGRFQGFYEHIELALMAEAGMTPDRILVAATGDAARCLGREDIGTVEPGKWADLLVLQADPLADARNLRLIESVWIAGNQVPGR